MSSPADELVDLLDANGNAVGMVSRGEMRRRRLPHRCVYLLVFNLSGELFLHQRTATKDVYPAFWDVTAGGVVAAGESFVEAARREGREELGVPMDLVELFPFRYRDEFTDVFAEVYRAHHSGPFCLQPEEVQRGEFVALSELPARFAAERFCPDGLAVWSEYCRRCEEENL